MEHFRLKFDPVANPDAMVQIGNARFTLLTSRLIRMEYSPDGDGFEDRASQPFWYRRQPTPEYTAAREGALVTIETDHLRLRYVESAAGFTPETLTITLKETDTVWKYGEVDPRNLRGTARTLDGVSGQTPLEAGILSRSGWAVVDDSRTLIFNADGWLEARKSRRLDLYFFGYGHDYPACLRDYMQVAGKIPLLPRWSLGNWWSRYWDYTQDELTNLMMEFIAYEVPLSVCIVDMDWHITETGNKSHGWTGYTWNRDLFPDPAGFIAGLHDLGLRTALNLHPADGVHPHEAAYPAMAERLGVQAGEPVPFGIEDPKFAQAYFELLHHPQEAQGVDFWWIDWQQGTSTSVPGLDPLWWLNHLHFYDLARAGDKRSFIFSRWGGLGNHRYPIGFSGDTHVTWESLAYQPFFTATAANVGYGWWSHDIGGHYLGMEDSELYTRWVQFGVFSPIFRLHSGKNVYLQRLPWGHDAETFRVTAEAMRLRHALIPYLYSQSWRAATQNAQPITPMYHAYPEHDAAYACLNQYTFGSELIAAPFIHPADPDTRLSRQVVWMPPGDWFNFFDGQYYAGDRWYALYGTLDEVPVFAKAGAIVPLAPKVGWGGVENPTALDVYVFPGADNTFELFEDDGVSTAYQQGVYSIIRMTQTSTPETLTFTIGAAEGETAHLPEHRVYNIHFRGVELPQQVEVTVNGTRLEQPGDYFYDTPQETLKLASLVLTPTDTVTITLRHNAALIARRDRTLETCLRMVKSFRMLTRAKDELLHRHMAEMVADYRLLRQYGILLSDGQRRALLEVLTGAGVEFITNASPRQQPLILWNNRGEADIRYQLYRQPDWFAVLEDEVIPASKTLTVEPEDVLRARISYADVMIVEISR